MNKKKKLTTEETFALALQNHNKNNLQVAENLYKEILKTNYKIKFNLLYDNSRNL
jgi:hypothetical protein